MKIINGKAYKEIKLKELDKEELCKIIEDLQTRVETLENNKSVGGSGTNITPWYYSNNPLSVNCLPNDCVTLTNECTCNGTTEACNLCKILTKSN